MSRLLLPALLLSALCADAAKLDNVGSGARAFPALDLQGYLPPTCTPKTSTVLARPQTVRVQTSSVVYVPGQAVRSTRVVSVAGPTEVARDYTTVTSTVRGATSTRYVQSVRSVNVPGPTVTVYTTLRTTRTSLNTVATTSVRTRTDVREVASVVTSVVPQNVFTTIMTTVTDRRRQTSTVVRDVYTTVTRTVTQPAVTRRTTVTRQVPSPPRTTTVYQTTVVNQERYTTVVDRRVRTTTVTDIDYSTSFALRTVDRVQSTTVRDYDTTTRYTQVQRYTTVSVPGATVRVTSTVSVPAPRPPVRPATTVYSVTTQIRSNNPAPVTTVQTRTTTLRQRGQDVVRTSTVEAACQRTGYRYDAPSVAFDFPRRG